MSIAINVVAALKNSPYEDVSEALAKEFARVNIETKDMVKNAPLRLKVTYGADIYKVMELIMVYEKPVPIRKKGVK